MEQPRGTSLLAGAIAAVKNDQAHPYEGADRGNAVRLVALLWALSGLLTFVFLPLEPPTDKIGTAGWLVAAGLIATSFIGAGRLLRSTDVGFGALLAVSYAGVLQIALFAWLSGGASSEYEMLFLLWICSGLGVHPPLRALTFLAVTGLVSAAHLLYDGWSSESAVDVATNVLFWTALASIMLTLMVTIRAQRVSLRAGELRERELARADALTGLGNRRAFDEALDHELARAGRAHSSVSVVVFDVDGLKGVNDEFGHVEGDRCLVAVGEAIVRSVRAGDRAFRWGGDEFAILLPDTDYNGAETAAATVYAEVMRTCADPRGRPLSVSAGIAQADGATGIEELVDIADMELMARKREKLALER